MDNYEATGELKKGKLMPKRQRLYKGMRVFLTKNVEKPEDFVNGMGAVVEHFDKSAQCLEVTTDTGKRLSVFLYTETIEGKRGMVRSFPVRVGYATTIQKVQGATLDSQGEFQRLRRHEESRTNRSGRARCLGDRCASVRARV